MTDIPSSRPAGASREAAVQPRGRATLRTLIIIRWIAVAGQLAAVLLVHLALGYPLPLGPALATIGASALLNLAATAQRSRRPRLTDRDAVLYLAYDTLQLAVLLHLTGGLENPFAILILAPLTVAATILSRRNVIALTLLALVCLTVIALWHFPLPWPDESLRLPPVYSLGQWLALTLSSAFIAAYVWNVAEEDRRISRALAASQMALAREQRLSALGALAAAAAHELGSPLGTIAVVAKELARDTPADSAFGEDIALLQSQIERCRHILADLARKPEAEGGAPFDRLPVRALVEEAAAPHRQPGVAIAIETEAAEGSVEPVLGRRPEILHGLGNLAQNAVQFARTRVTVRVRWDAEAVTIAIADDGPGFPPNLLGRLGEPYLSTRTAEGDHMGLGIFIAQTLLERTGADVSFGNGRSGGARVVLRWRRAILEHSL